MRNLFKAMIISNLLLTLSHAEESKPRRVKLGSEHRPVTSAAKLTGGIISSSAGALHFVAFPIIDLIYSGKVKPLKLELSEKRRTYSITFSSI